MDGTRVSFEELWERREPVEVAPGVTIFRPSVEGLILTKRFGNRPKDAEDIRMLEVLQRGEAALKPTPEHHAEIRTMSERALTREEFDAWVNAPMSDEERDGILDLIAWFTRRYPTPGERLRAGRVAWKHALKLMPPAPPTGHSG